MKRKILLQPVLGGVEITFRTEHRENITFVWRDELRELLRLLEEMVNLHKTMTPENRSASPVSQGGTIRPSKVPAYVKVHRALPLTIDEHLAVASLVRRMKQDRSRISAAIWPQVPVKSALSRNLLKLGTLLGLISSDIENLYFRDTTEAERMASPKAFPHYGYTRDEEAAR